MIKIKIPKSDRKKALIVVDVQPIFLKAKNRHVLRNINEVIRSAPYDLYINAVFYADNDSIWKKQLNWTVPKIKAKTYTSIRMALDKKKYVVNIVKQTKSVFKGETVPKHISVNRILSNHGIEEVHIVGFDTNDCVLATAYEAFDLGYFTFVIEECVQSSSGDDMHNAGLLLLRNVDLTNHQKK